MLGYLKTVGLPAELCGNPHRTNDGSALITRKIETYTVDTNLKGGFEHEYQITCFSANDNSNCICHGIFCVPLFRQGRTIFDVCLVRYN